MIYSKLFISLLLIFVVSTSHGQNKYEEKINIGMSYLRINNYLEAEAAFKNALQYNPNGYTAYFGLGLVYSNMCSLSGEKCEESVFYLNKAAKIDSNKNNIHYWLGRTYGFMGSFDKALLEFNISINKRADTSALTSRALVKIKLNDLNGACQDFYLSSKLGSKVGAEQFKLHCAFRKK